MEEKRRGCGLSDRRSIDCGAVDDSSPSSLEKRVIIKEGVDRCGFPVVSPLILLVLKEASRDFSFLASKHLA